MPCLIPAASRKYSVREKGAEKVTSGLRVSFARPSVAGGAGVGDLQKEDRDEGHDHPDEDVTFEEVVQVEMPAHFERYCCDQAELAWSVAGVGIGLNTTEHRR